MYTWWEHQQKTDQNGNNTVLDCIFLLLCYRFPFNK